MVVKKEGDLSGHPPSEKRNIREITYSYPNF